MATQYSFGKIDTNGLVYCVDAGDRNSYVGTGTIWNDLAAGGSRGLTLSGSVPTPTFSTGNGGYLSLDGTDDFIRNSTANATIGSSVSVNITMGVWVYPTTINTNHILGRIADPAAPTGNECGFNIQSNGEVGYYVGGYNAFGQTAAGAVTINKWHYIVFAYDQATIPRPRIYVNNIRYTGMNEGNFFTGIPNNTACFIGFSWTRGFNSVFAGRVAAFHIYNRTLTDAEVFENYNKQKGRFGL